MRQTVNILVAAFAATALLSASAFAQTAPPPAPVKPSSEPLDTTPPPTLDPDALPVAKDPMLDPVPPAANVVESWGDIIRLVHERSTALHIATAQVREATAMKRRALSASLPVLSANGSVNEALYTNYNGTAAVLHPNTTLNGSVALKQPILDLGAWYSFGTAKEREQAAALSSKDVQRQQLERVAEAAVGVITESRVAESSRVSLASDLSTLELTRRRAELGAANAVDVLRAAQEVATSRAAIVANDEALRQSRETLGAALGFTGGWGVSNDLRVEDLERAASGVCKPIEGIQYRTDIRSAERNVEAARRDRNAVDYLYVPTVALVSQLGYTDYRSPGDTNVTQWTVGAQLGWTLYDGGDRYGQKLFNTAAETIARETLTQNKRDARLLLTQADRGIVVAQANLEVSTSARNIAKESARLSRLAFINGNGTSFDLVDSARRLREAEIDLLIKQFQVFQARLTAFLSRANCAI
ncbi:MAG TPA: TolC family protein [Polyangiaceae bacterium]|jgi:outer membrane protein TolC|nr:TolC family protein [Polyangiaceae bacterium]